MLTKSLCAYAVVACAAAHSLALGQVVKNRSPLQPNHFDPLPLGAVAPEGWLKSQLEIQANGLTGHLDEFWKDVSNDSAWLGGKGEGWERGPYFLDGLLPLAYELKDQKLIAKADRWVDWTLTHQLPSGQIGPTSNDDWWPRMVMLKVLTQYAEVTGDKRVIPLMTKYFAYELRELPGRPLRDWGKYRWQDNAYTVIWLYNRTGDKQLLDLLRLLHKQGYDWEAQFTSFRYKGKVSKEELGLSKGPPPDMAMQTHGVNNAMALKTAPIWFTVTGARQDRNSFAQMMVLLDKYQGLPNGMFSGDEHFAGIDPSQGIELCAVVETMFSFEDAFAILGDPRIADRLEKVSYNALPATLSDDLWSHQYDQQPNQIACSLAHRQWSTNGDASNLFGLEPNFGCCTANLHQGWPKLVSSLFMATPDGGLAVTAYAPSRVTMRLKNVAVELGEQTEYPFRGDVQFTVKAQQLVEFPLVLRMPGWAESATVKVNGAPVQGWTKPSCSNTDQYGESESCNPADAFHTVRRTWKTGDTVQVTFAMPARVTRWFHNSAVVERGPLVFALPVKAEWVKLKSYAEKSADWELKPESKWNYGLDLGDCNFSVKQNSIGSVPFSSAQPPVTLGASGRQVPSWTIQENSAGQLPISPVESTGPVDQLTLIPYGAAKLRITAFPVVGRANSCGGAAAKESRHAE